MDNKVIPLISLVVLLVLSAAGVLYYKSLEFEVTEEDVGFSDEARKNRFLLSQKFLEMGNHQVSTHNSIQDLPIAYNETTDVVISNIANPVTSRVDVHRLETWIKKGGTYIISMSDNQLEAGAMNEDHFAKYFEVYLTENEQPVNLATSNRSFDCEYDSYPEINDLLGFDLSEITDPLNNDAEEELLDEEIDSNENEQDLEYEQDYEYATISNEEIEFKTLFVTDNDLSVYEYEYEELFYSGSYERYYLIRYSLGKGTIWFNYSNEIFNNEYFGCADHAKILNFLLQDKKRVAFLSHIEYTSFKNILFDYAKPALTLSVILFVFICWYFIKHLFHYRVLRLNSAPKFSGHILAISHLIKRENTVHEHILELINHINENAKLILPEFTHENLVKLIKTKTNLDEQLIELALSREAGNIQSTTKQIKLLQMIRKAL